MLLLIEEGASFRDRHPCPQPASPSVGVGKSPRLPSPLKETPFSIREYALIFKEKPKLKPEDIYHSMELAPAVGVTKTGELTLLKNPPIGRI